MYYSLIFGIIFDVTTLIDNSQIAIVFFLKDPDNELDFIADKGHVYKMAEQYANTGFEIIADYIDKKRPDDLIWDLFLELDTQYEEINQQ